MMESLDVFLRKEGYGAGIQLSASEAAELLNSKIKSFYDDQEVRQIGDSLLYFNGAVHLTVEVRDRNLRSSNGGSSINVPIPDLTLRPHYDDPFGLELRSTSLSGFRFLLDHKEGRTLEADAVPYATSPSGERGDMLFLKSSYFPKGSEYLIIVRSPSPVQILHYELQKVPAFARTATHS